ncbi:MFS transporter [Halalkalibacter sp. AB-rgal2]|uniref:MFS transporter n=1 Tax=Halalkalibacter sp. AB-rgal2 TaxID=3242695 RepID=UPI00359E74B5
MNKQLIKTAILSVSLLTVMAGAAISPALGDIALAFPNSNETTIKLILTLPSVMIIPFIFVSSHLTRRFSKKSILLIGMVFYLIGGLGGGLVPTIELLLLFRAILGIGVGLMMPLSTSLVADFFDGQERTTTMGQVSAVNNLGGVVLFLLSGVLAAISWRMAFSVYTLVVVSVIIVWLFLPKQQLIDRGSKVKLEPLPKSVYFTGASMFFIILVFFALPSNMALFMQQEGIGNSQNAGMVISAGTAAGFVAGLILAQIKRIFQRFFYTVMLLLMAIGFLIIAFAPNAFIIGCGVGLMGFGFGSLMPTVFDHVTRIVPRVQVVQAMAVVTSMLFLGQFLSPIILDSIGILVGDESIRFTYFLLAGSLFLVSTVFFIHASSRRSTINGSNQDMKGS